MSIENDDIAILAKYHLANLSNNANLLTHEDNAAVLRAQAELTRLVIEAKEAADLTRKMLIEFDNEAAQTSGSLRHTMH
jgi:hypothetical protein